MRRALTHVGICASRYDATSHFETTVEDVLEMYTRITGKVLDLSSKDPSKAQQ
jgi:Rab GDP dissociation inhibitor